MSDLDDLVKALGGPKSAEAQKKEEDAVRERYAKVKEELSKFRKSILKPHHVVAADTASWEELQVLWMAVCSITEGWPLKFDDGMIFVSYKRLPGDEQGCVHVTMGCYTIYGGNWGRRIESDNFSSEVNARIWTHHKIEEAMQTLEKWVKDL